MRAAEWALSPRGADERAAPAGRSVHKPYTGPAAKTKGLGREA